MEFDETRLYQPGDDIRSIDWRVTARSGSTPTKLYREERERPVFISVDNRANMHFATRGVLSRCKPQNWPHCWPGLHSKKVTALAAKHLPIPPVQK